MTRSLVVESWRFIPHSLAVVNQFQCLELLKRKDIHLYFRDVPFYGRWSKKSNLLSYTDEAAIQSLAEPPPDFAADATYRLSYPYRLSPSGSPRTCVMVNSEFDIVPDSAIEDAASWREASQRDDLTIASPSQWARGGLLRAGVKPDRIHVVPHGVDLRLFHPLSSGERTALRKELGWEGQFVMLNISSMLGCKGIMYLLNAFASIIDDCPHVRLMLKGSDALYSSKTTLKTVLSGLTGNQAQKVVERLHYFGGTFSFELIARLYQAADVYVAPYTAESFNIPVLEAIACGLPVICTGGGPTDEFTRDGFARRIRSIRQRSEHDPRGPISCLKPDAGHLKELMRHVVEDRSFREGAREAGPEFVQANGFTWKHVVDKLVSVCFDEP